MAVVKERNFTKNEGNLQNAEETVLNVWIALINGGADPLQAAADGSVFKEVTKLKGSPKPAKGGTHELHIGAVNRVFFKYTSTTVTLTNVGHT